MEILRVDVKSKSKVVGTAEYEKFDSVDEAKDFFGESPLLGIVNAQHRTNKMNVIRTAANPTQSKRTLQYQVMASLTTEELIAIHGDSEALERLVASKIKELEAQAPEAVEA